MPSITHARRPSAVTDSLSGHRRSNPSPAYSPQEQENTTLFNLEKVVQRYGGQPQLLELILSSKVEEDRRRAEEAKLKRKEIDYLLQHPHCEESSVCRSSPSPPSPSQQSVSPYHSIARTSPVPHWRRMSHNINQKPHNINNSSNNNNNTNAASPFRDSISSSRSYQLSVPAGSRDRPQRNTSINDNAENQHSIPHQNTADSTLPRLNSSSDHPSIQPDSAGSLSASVTNSTGNNQKTSPTLVPYSIYRGPVDPMSSASTQSPTLRTSSHQFPLLPASSTTPNDSKSDNDSHYTSSSLSTPCDPVLPPISPDTRLTSPYSPVKRLSLPSLTQSLENSSFSETESLKNTLAPVPEISPNPRPRFLARLDELERKEKAKQLLSSPEDVSDLRRKSSTSSYPSDQNDTQFQPSKRRRREMQAITTIIETRDFPYNDDYLWKNNGNTIQKKTGLKSVYYKCSNSMNGCPVNKTVIFKGDGAYLIKYRGRHMNECNRIKRIIDK
ncbi:uncharacterized protein BYT42DRAFT_613336 [Radiomyces spectabilis]|uniref:uncharacterized protein n=1 Tax=Radiomyces spectabilis TaxID=64574 RepID=UPI00221FA085|nr:uncharacterized protein BYT42DRAFT_613336 [Radiomyces spectabilis]KAI8381563.1 hypothetical protein BYT42DRAFT_613336 [Radiomyces spectabilis]